MSQNPDDFQAAFWAAKHALAIATAAAFAKHGVHEGQQFVLRRLWEEDGLTPGEVARRLGLSTPTVTKATTRMEAAGLLVREPHPTDRRMVRLRLTERGRAIEQSVNAETERITERALNGLDGRERAALTGALRRITKNLKALFTERVDGMR